MMTSPTNHAIDIDVGYIGHHVAIETSAEWVIGKPEGGHANIARHAVLAVRNVINTFGRSQASYHVRKGIIEGNTPYTMQRSMIMKFKLCGPQGLARDVGPNHSSYLPDSVSTWSVQPHKNPLDGFYASDGKRFRKSQRGAS